MAQEMISPAGSHLRRRAPDLVRRAASWRGRWIKLGRGAGGC